LDTQPSDQTSKLTPVQQQSYRERGYFFPVRAFDAQEAAGFRQRFQSYVDQYAERMKALLPRDRRVYLTETHLFLDWVYRIVSHPRVLDAVESVLGPNLLVWGSQWFPKMPGDKAYVSWHQDGTYWGLTPPNVTTAWIALSASTPENGCMRVVPQTHQASMLPQRETYAPDNMLSRGQEIAVQVDETQAVDLVLGPGEFSLHHIGTVHGSGPNHSNAPRIGLAIRYITPDVVQQGSRDLALLVRGKDEYGHFDLIAPPDHDGSPEESSTHAEALRRKSGNIMPKPPAI
jgi:ectoine hydroxylase-related dioxygenase (phytanoyl-CoA dioxygenase family)